MVVPEMVSHDGLVELYVNGPVPPTCVKLLATLPPTFTVMGDAGHCKLNPPLTVTLHDAVAIPPAASNTVNVYGTTPADVNVPDNTPVFWLMVSGAPPVSENVYGVVPPPTTAAAEKGVLAFACVAVGHSSVNGPFTVIWHVLSQSVAPTLSCTHTL